MIRKFCKTFFGLSLFLAIFLVANTNQVQASAAHNIRGWAYNSNYGYISMNCLDDNFAGRFPFTFPFPFWIAPCAVSMHGVNLDTNNNFSGDAWNTILGFIDFEGPTVPDAYAFNINCQSTCNASNNCTACYNESSGTVHGWAKVVLTGKWIKLDDSSMPPMTRISDYNSAVPGIFSGYASSSIGAVSFNCTNDGSCATNPYEVKIGPLEIRQLSAPNWSSAPNEACTNGQARRAVLRWNRRSGTQSAYQVIVNKTNSTTTPPMLDTGKVGSIATQQTFYAGSLEYDQPYYWFLRLWDENDVPTVWRQFDTAITSVVKDRLTDNSARNTQRSAAPNKTFTTYRHEYPLPSFTYSPTEPLIGSSTVFISTSRYYNNTEDTNPCTGATCSYIWSLVGDVRATNTTPTLDTTTITFTRPTSTTVTLTLTDIDAIYTCSTSTTISANYGLPIWKEIKPK